MTRREREALVEKLFGCAFSVDANQPPRLRKPGQVIERLTPEVRRKLAELTAADFQHRVS